MAELLKDEVTQVKLSKRETWLAVGRGLCFGVLVSVMASAMWALFNRAEFHWSGIVRRSILVVVVTQIWVRIDNLFSHRLDT